MDLGSHPSSAFQIESPGLAMGSHERASAQKGGMYALTSPIAYRPAALDAIRDGRRTDRLRAERRPAIVLPSGQDRLASGRRQAAHDRDEQASVHRVAAAAPSRV